MAEPQMPRWSDVDLEQMADPVTREAIHWFTLMQDDRLSRDHRAAFNRWRCADPANERAFHEVEQLWSGFACLRDRPPAGLSRRRVIGALAILGVASGTGLAYRHFAQADFATGKGERRTIELPDRGRIELSASTALSMGPERTAATARLHYGQAYFELQPGPGTTFTVNTRQGDIASMGASFDLSDEGEYARLTVLRHGTEVRARSRVLRVDDGMQVDFGSWGIGRPQAVDTLQVTAWREGRLMFVNARLDRIVANINRWRRGRIVIVGDALASRTATLIVNVADIDDALDHLRDAVGLSVIRLTPYLTVLS